MKHYLFVFFIFASFSFPAFSDCDAKDDKGSSCSCQESNCQIGETCYCNNSDWGLTCSCKKPDNENNETFNYTPAPFAPASYKLPISSDMGVKVNL